MDNKKFQLVILGLLTVGLFVSLKYKNVNVFQPTTPQASRPFPDDWNPNMPQADTPGPAPQIPGQARSYKEAVELAAKVNKPLLLFFTSSNCPPCVKMKKELAPSIAQSQDKIVYWEVNTDVDKDLVAKFKITLTPSYLIINGNEQVMKRGSGYLSVQDFANWMAAPYQPETPPTPPAPPTPPTPPQQPPQKKPPQPRPSPGGG